MLQPNNITIVPIADEGLLMNFAKLMASSDPWLTLQLSAGECRTAFNGPGKEVFVATLNGNAAGFVILQMHGTFKGYVQTLFVSSEYRSCGIGSKLLAFCEKHIADVSPNVFICVSAFNTAALKLYRNHGFTVVGTLTNFIKDGFDELLLRKSTGPIAGYQPPTQ